jgi:hypothetical protein
MNAKTPHDGGFDATESGERADAVRLLPTPAVPDLPVDRLRLLKEHLMSEIHHPEPTARPAAGTAPGTAVGTAPAPRRRTRRWVPIIAPLAAAAVVAAVLTAGVDHHGRPADTARPAPSKASALLENAADVVSRAPAVEVGHHQFVYVRSEVTGRDNPVTAEWIDKKGHAHVQKSKVPEKMTKLESLRDWIPWSRSQGAAEAYGDRAPEGVNLPGPGQGMAGGPGHLTSPFEDLAALPHDPAAAFRTIEADLRRQMDNAENTKGNKRPYVYMPWVFGYLAGMLQESVDPRTTAFLYRVAAQVPGTTVIPDAVDAAGRHGVAISMDAGLDSRQEWIFDKSTYAYLGFSEVTLRDTVIGPAGSVILVSAVLQRAVVDHAGQEPGKTTG